MVQDSIFTYENHILDKIIVTAKYRIYNNYFEIYFVSWNMAAKKIWTLYFQLIGLIKLYSSPWGKSQERILWQGGIVNKF